MHHNDSKAFSARTGLARLRRRNGESDITGIIDQFLSRANRRHIANLAFEYLSVAVAAGAAGLILLLVLGRQVLDWYWPVLLFLVALAAGFWRARRRLLSRYQLAQTVDQRLELDDRLSTLVYFQAHPASSPELLSLVEAQARERLQEADLPRAVPVVFPRYGYASAALLLAAGGLVGVRYGVLRTMDLNPPLANIRFQSLETEPKAYAATKKSAIQERWEEQLKQLGLTPEDLQQPDEKGLTPIESQVPGASEPGTTGAPNPEGVKNMKAPQSSPEGGEEGSEGEKSGEGQESASGDSGSGDQKQGKPQQKDAPQNAKNGQQGNPGQEGVMNKMRDALANLMNKLKTPSKDGQQSAQNSAGQQQGQQAGKQPNQQGQQSQGRQQGEGQPSGDQQGSDQQQNGEKMAGNQSQSGDQNSDRPGDQNAKSGMGLQDGDKAIREAQQLAAMGKISEIIGKRQQQLTGEMTVEVSSGKQQLKTQWSDRRALHADTGAESNRNEIPLQYQTYIQRYFEEVRKANPGPKSKAQ